MKRDAFCHVHIVKNTVSKGLGTGRRDGGAVRNTTRVGLQQAAVSDGTVANLRTECCSQNRGHVESKPTCVNEIWLISAKVHHCHSTELPVFPKINGSLLEFIPLWRNVPLEYCVCVQAENTAENSGWTPLFNMKQLWNQNKLRTASLKVRCTLPTQMWIQQWPLPYLKFCIMAGISSCICWTHNTDFNRQYLHCHRHYSCYPSVLPAILCGLNFEDLSESKTIIGWNIEVKATV